MERDLLSISPVDGRYRKVTAPLAAYFSESAIIRYRILVEVEYFIALCKVPLPQLKGFNTRFFPKLRALYSNFNDTDALRVKEIEKVTNHDVKAVEYFLKEKFEGLPPERSASGNTVSRSFSPLPPRTTI